MHMHARTRILATFLIWHVTFARTNATATIMLTEDRMWHSRVNHVRVKFHYMYIRELVPQGDVAVI
jgi:hypothetical protein